MISRDILARHRNAHQLDDVRKSAPQTSKAMFRACFQCATARVKCSGSTPCQRCSIKEHECCYPVQTKKKPKARKKFQVREMFRANEGNQIPGDETIRIDNLNITQHPHVSTWPVTQSSLVPDPEIRMYQMQDQSQQSPSSLAHAQRLSSAGFIDEFNVSQTDIQASQAEQLRVWMRNSAIQQPMDQFEPDFNRFPTTLPCDFSANTTQAFANIHVPDSTMNWISPPRTDDSHFPFDARQFDGAGFDSVAGVSNIGSHFEHEALFGTEIPSGHQDQDLYCRNQNSAIVQVSSPISLQSSNAFASSPKKHHSPATSISPSLGSVYNPEGAESLHLQSSTECDNRLSVQIPHRIRTSSPIGLHSPSNSISPSSGSIYYTEAANIQEFQHAPRHQSRSSWDDTRSTPFPSPRIPSTSQRQCQIPISIEKQVQEYAAAFLPAIPSAVYTNLMSQFKQHCLKHHQPFLSDYFPSAAVLELSAHLYFEHFHSIFPLLSKSPLSTFTEGVESSMLLLAICAIGVGYLGTADAWTCSEAFLEFFKRLQEHAQVELCGADSKKNGMMQLQARILSVVALFRNPNQSLVEQAYDDRSKLISVFMKDGLLGGITIRWSNTEISENGGDWDEAMFVEAKRRAACCIWVC
jgi:hypothetical protein